MEQKKDWIKQILKQIEQPLWSDWMIKEKIGAGSFSEVYRMEAERNGGKAVSALKIEPLVTGRIAYSNEDKERYIKEIVRLADNEIDIMHQLKDCPNIVHYEEMQREKFFYYGNFEGYYQLIRMEFLSCIEDLLYKRQFDLSEKNIRKLALEIGNGISAIHKKGIMHRDIKPGNLFVSRENVYKLGDFNISKQSETAETVAGTDEYMAPEVYGRAENSDTVYTKQTDIYSFGITLYYFLNGLRFPLEDANVTLEQALIRRISGRKFPPPENASPEFGEVIRKACAYQAEERFQTIEEMVEAVRNLPGIVYPDAGEFRKSAGNQQKEEQKESELSRKDESTGDENEKDENKKDKSRNDESSKDKNKEDKNREETNREEKEEIEETEETGKTEEIEEIKRIEKIKGIRRIQGIRKIQRNKEQKRGWEAAGILLAAAMVFMVLVWKNMGFTEGSRFPLQDGMAGEAPVKNDTEIKTETRTETGTKAEEKQEVEGEEIKKTETELKTEEQLKSEEERDMESRKWMEKVTAGDPDDFIIEDGVLKKYQGNGSYVKIPDEVEEIGEKAFARQKNLKGVVMPDTVEIIGFRAFAWCENLKYVKMSENVKLMEKNTFRGCRRLKSIVIPEGVEKIKLRTFQDCVFLESVQFSEGVKTIGCLAFEGCKRLKEIRLPYSMKKVDTWAFSRCGNIEKVVVPNEKTEIFWEAFEKKAEQLKFYCHSNSKASDYAKKEEFPYFATSLS